MRRRHPSAIPVRRRTSTCTAMNAAHCPSKVPYGYRSQRVADASGREHTKLVLGPENEVETVREIFRLLAAMAVVNNERHRGVVRACGRPAGRRPPHLRWGRGGRCRSDQPCDAPRKAVMRLATRCRIGFPGAGSTSSSPSSTGRRVGTLPRATSTISRGSWARGRPVRRESTRRRARAMAGASGRCQGDRQVPLWPEEL